MLLLMLRINKKPRNKFRTTLFSLVALLFMGAGLYLLALVSAPIIMPYVASKKLDPANLPSPQIGQDRVIIPKIGVDIPYSQNESSLNSGAWWRHSDRGSPKKGGNFILAAHRFEIQPTPLATWQKSPFYHIDKLVVGDDIITDYQGKRYGYKVDAIIHVKPTQTEIEATSTTPKLTLYSCTLGGAADGRIVITAKPIGEVVIQSKDRSEI